MKRVYFAGKVEKNGWRDQLLLDRCMSRGEFIYDNHFLYAGPFAIGCDHGCFHGEASHGLLEANCCGSIGDELFDFDAMSPREAVRRCFAQVEGSDLVVAYLDRDDCQGTIVELGYAIALRKPILLFHENPINVDLNSVSYPHSEVKDELWFVKHGPGVECHRGPVDMEQILNRLKVIGQGAK